MKKYVTILIGIVVLFVVLYGGQSLMNKRPQAGVVDIKSSVGTKLVTGDVIREFEGLNRAEYTFSVPETASTSVEMEGALIRVENEGSPLVSIYFSYEGARGYGPMDYINNIVAPHVSIITPTATSTIGGYDWQGAESEGSEWHIAPVLLGKWLIVVESKKTVHDAVQSILESVMVK